MNADLRELVADETRLRDALAQADTAPLLMVLVQLTGKESWLDKFRPFIAGPWDYSESAPPELGQALRERLIGALKGLAAGDRAPPPPSRALLQKMMSVCAGEAVADEYVPMMLEELALTDRDPKGVAWLRRPPEPALRGFRVAVIGAGMSGLCAGIKLRQAGIPFTIFEKNDAVGGTWYENAYPGCGVDTPNHFYCYSFEPSYHWSHYFSKRDELWAYLERCADAYDVRRGIRLRTEVQAAQFDERRQLWSLSVRSAGGAAETLEANAVVCAVGQLNRPQVPPIEGLERFKGPVFHTAQWDARHEVRGRRVALIGTGASGIQVAPSIAGEVERLTIFQRSPHWVVPNPNYHRTVSEGKKWVLRHLPHYARWYRFQLFWGFGDGLHPALQIDPEWETPQISLNATNERHRRAIIRHIKREIGDDEALLAKVIPSYPPYGKRILIDTHWYRTLKRENVDLVTEPIDHVGPEALVTRDARSHPADMIVLATGFQAARMLWPLDIRGRDGRSIRSLWGEDDPRAYLGITVPGFPNLFILYGPNTNLGHGGSIIFHTECQVRYTMQCLRELIEAGRASLECRQEVHDAYNERVDRAHRRMVWSHPGMTTWYRNRRGRVITNSPWRLVDYWRMTAAPDLRDFIVR